VNVTAYPSVARQLHHRCAGGKASQWHGFEITSFEAAYSKFLSCLFADDVGRRFIRAESKENRVAHLAVTSPLGEFYFADELGN
jgi:hypothetical protein